jgi:hypothetical protein
MPCPMAIQNASGCHKLANQFASFHKAISFTWYPVGTSSITIS